VVRILQPGPIYRLPPLEADPQLHLRRYAHADWIGLHLSVSARFRSCTLAVGGTRGGSCRLLAHVGPIPAPRPWL
jgi:hypothetical protein